MKREDILAVYEAGPDAVMALVAQLLAAHQAQVAELTTRIASAVTGEGASAAVSWLVTAFLDAVFGFLLGSILIPVVNVLLVPVGVLFPEK